MEADAIRKIEQLVNEVQKPIHVDSEPDDVYYLRNAQGELERKVAEPEAIFHRFYTTESMFSLFQGVKDTKIFASEHKIDIIAPAEQPSRFLSGFIRLDKHPALLTIYKHLETKSYTQKQLVKLLATKLSDFVDEDVIRKFRSLTLVQSATAHAAVEKDAAVLGLQENSGFEEDVPPAVLVNCPVFDLPELLDKKQSMRLLIETSFIDNTFKFELTAVHNDLAKAVHNTLSDFIAELADGEHPVYFASLH